MALNQEQIEALRLTGDKWVDQQLRPIEKLSPGDPNDPNARVEYPAEESWPWTLLPDQVDQVRDAINALLLGMVEAIANNETVNQSLGGKEASGVAAQLVSDLASTVNQSLSGKEASGVAAQLVSDLASTVNQSLSGKEASGVAAQLVSDLASTVNQSLSGKEASGVAAQLVSDLADTVNQSLAGKEASGVAAQLVSDLADAVDIALSNKEPAGTAAELFSQLNLDAINQQLDVDAVAVFIYDTRNDSDSGSWRLRCADKGWYSETLNTATRGTRREFPTLAIIVAENDKVTIYDGDGPILSMWMVCQNYPSIYLPGTMSAVHAKNGIIWIAQASGTESNELGALGVLELLADICYQRVTGVAAYWPNSIANRNAGLVSTTIPTYFKDGIAHRSINRIDTKVLPDAPIDHRTGLPIPTVYLTTADGVTVLNHDETVFNKTGYLSTYKNPIAILDNGEFLTSWVYGDSVAIYAVENADSGLAANTDALYLPKNAPHSTLFVQKTKGVTVEVKAHGNQLMIASTTGISLIHRHREYSQSMAYHLTSEYPSGWMVGDTKAALLASTDVNSLVGEDSISNGHFANGTTGWSSLYAESITVQSGALRLLQDSSVAYGARAYQIISTVIGQAYVVTAELVGLNLATNGNIVASTSVNHGGFPNQTGGVGAIELHFVAQSTTTYIHLSDNSVSDGSYSDWDNVSVRLADHDRSVHAKGLAVLGTVGRQQVATGAELVGFGGFDANHYLWQLYSSELDFGAGDFSVIGWMESTDNWGHIFDRVKSDITGSRIRLDMFEGDFRFRDHTAIVQGGTGGTADDGAWHQFAFVRSGGLFKIYQDSVEQHSFAHSADLSSVGAELRIGISMQNDGALNGLLSLLRISATAPTADQITKMYNDERKLFEENAQCTLFGTSDNINAMDFDEVTGLLHAGTNQGRSVFDFPKRVDNNANVVTAIAAHDGLVVEA